MEELLQNLPACLWGCAVFAPGQLCCSCVCKGFRFFFPHSTGSSPSVSQFYNGLKSTKLIRYCRVTGINTFHHSQGFCQWCHWVIYCLQNKDLFINEKMSSNFIFIFSKPGYSSNFSLTYFTTKNMVLQKSYLNIKEEIVHFFKNIESRHEKLNWEMYLSLDISWPWEFYAFSYPRIILVP